MSGAMTHDPTKQWRKVQRNIGLLKSVGALLVNDLLLGDLFDRTDSFDQHGWARNYYAQAGTTPRSIPKTAATRK